jgi:hypothetical protein
MFRNPWEATQETAQQTEGRQFHIGDIISIITGRLVSPTHINGIYNILNFMTNEDLLTHQLPRAQEECRQYLLNQHPDLANIDFTGFSANTLDAWLATQANQYGEYRMARRLPQGYHQFYDPIEEFELQLQASTEDASTDAPSSRPGM